MHNGKIPGFRITLNEQEVPSYNFSGKDCTLLGLFKETHKINLCDIKETQDKVIAYMEKNKDKMPFFGKVARRILKNKLAMKILRNPKLALDIRLIGASKTFCLYMYWIRSKKDGYGTLYVPFRFGVYPCVYRTFGKEIDSRKSYIGELLFKNTKYTSCLFSGFVNRTDNAFETNVFCTVYNSRFKVGGTNLWKAGRKINMHDDELMGKRENVRVLQKKLEKYDRIRNSGVLKKIEEYESARSYFSEQIELKELLCEAQQKKIEELKEEILKLKGSEEK